LALEQVSSTDSTGCRSCI